MSTGLGRTAHRRGSPLDSGQAVLLAGIGAVALVAAVVLVHLSATAALALAAVPPVVWYLGRTEGGLCVGIALVLMLPVWKSVGTAQVSVLRLASLAAVITLVKGGRIKLVALDLAVFLFVAVLLGGWLIQNGHSGRVLTTELTPVGLYLGARAVPLQKLPTVLLVILGAGTVGALTVIYEFVHGSALFINPLSYSWNGKGGGIFRPGGVFGSPPGASTALSVVVLFGLAYLKQPVTSARLRPVAIGCICTCALALTLTFTRAGWIGLGVGLLLFLWLTRSSLLRPLRVGWAVAGIATILFLLMPVLEQTKTFQKGVLRAGTLTTRESYWGVALPVVTSSADRFLVGVGPAVLEAPRTSQSVLLPSYLATSPQLVTTSLHSQYVTALVEQGLLGLVVLLAFLSAAGVPVARLARRTGDPSAAATAAAVAAVAVIMSVDTSLLEGSSFALLLTAAGLSGNMISASRQT